jgi:hypothetical protein
MKIFIRPRKEFLFPILLFFLFSYKFSTGQTLFGTASTPADGGTQAGPTAVVTPPGSMLNHDLVIIYAEYRGAVIPSMLQAGGQTWNTATTYSPGVNQSIAVFWCTFNGTWGANPSVTVGAGNTSGLTAAMYVFRPSNSNNVWGVNALGTNSNSGTNPNSISALSPTMPNSVSMAYWASAATNTWGTLTGTLTGWSKTGLSTQIRNNTSGQSYSAAYNIMSTAGSTGNVSQTQSATTTAVKSIVSWVELSNDDCGGATTLIPGATCTNTGGMVAGATLSSGIPLPICGTPLYDVWYKFVATSTVQTITLSSLGTNFTNSGIQLLSGACASLSTVSCATGTSLTAPSLTIGSTYYIRVYSTSAPTSINGNFNICVVDAPANDDCSGAVALTSNQSCVATNGTLTNSTNVSIGTCNATRPDVWYSFTAQSVNPTITIGTIASGRFQVFSGTCGSLTSVFCSTSNTQTVSPNLTIGTTYFVRVMSSTVTTGNFTICIDDPAPANNDCASVVTLTSSTTCSNVTGSMYGATLSSITVNGDCAVSPTYDVWYRFTAQTTNPTISLSNIGVNFTNPAMELLSNNCGGTFTTIQCGTTSLAANFLTPGTIYYIRVYSQSGSVPTAYAGSTFDICVVDPVATAPFNDDCANAINLPIWNTCNNVAGSVAGATASSAPGLAAPCAGTVTYDVWYKFTALTSTANTITISSLGANFTSSGIQVFSGTCGSLTSVACNTGTSVTTPSLTVGNVYYIRVFSTAGSVPNGNARFNICATTTNAPVRSGNSYVNVSKKTAGGVIEPGDTLEIRFTVNHTSGTMTQLRFVDNVPSKTSMLATANDSIRIITNEGLTFRRYTPSGADADAAVYKASPGAGEYNIRLNVGFASGALPAKPTNNTNTTGSANGQMNAGSDRPRGGGGMLFAIAYRVKVTGVAGDTVKLFPGQFIYNNGTSDVTLTATPFNILISNPLNLCANSIGLNNAVENGGTFGSGNTLNRSYDLTTPIAGYTFLPDVSAYTAVGDGRYAIVNNISPKSDPVRTARRVPNCNSPTTLALNDLLNCNNRMHGGHWDIDGDHTGTNNAIGNVPPDATTPSGYMLEVNADYVASEVYRQTVSNLCPNTYYEFSAWLRNICKTCGIDSAGHQFTNTSGDGVPPPPANGYPGVLPNLTFTLDDLDYYNSGEIDTVGWLKKGFVFKTGPNQKTATFSIRNNAQGGGGNDWVLDDIAIATCLPTMMYSPSITPAVCQGNSLQVNDTVRSYFDNYTFYKWQRSTDGGSNWSDITGNNDTTLVNIGGVYQFITSYSIPAAHTTLADSGDLYRVIVATLDSNLLNSACLFTDASTIITLKVLDCGIPLGIDFISFSGKLNHGNADLIWTTSKEAEPVSYSVERSYDGTNFTSIGMVTGNNNPNAANNTYKFTDLNVQGKIWYRIAMVNKDGHKKYSRIVILEDKTVNFGLTNVVNPFSTKLDFGITVSENSRIDVTLINMSGKPVRKETFNVYAGANNLTVVDTGKLPVGMYILQIRNNDQIINKKVMKK